MLSIATKTARAGDDQPSLPATFQAGWLDFAGQLVRRGHLSVQSMATTGAVTENGSRLLAIWKATDLSADEFANETAQFFRYPRIDSAFLARATSLTGRFSQKFLRENAAYPCQDPDTSQSWLIVGDPTHRTALKAAELVLGGPVQIAIASFEDITAALAEVEVDPALSPVLPVPFEDRPVDVENLRDLASGAPVVRAVNDLLEKAVELRATDIHLEPLGTGLSIRLRVDGLLRSTSLSADVVPQAIISRIKILSGLNIAERRLPQDGAAHLRVAHAELDIRVATMPTQHGEAAVLRLLPKERGTLEIAKLGFADHDRAKVQELLQLPHGMLIVTGPTGSGKTTTLATILTQLNDNTRKILTIEDPVEYEIRGVCQSQVNPGIGLTFASALRSFLRQDPDVIMVGEIRDRETASVAIHAALTGHLVLTTLHTETAAAAIPRLLDLGVEPFLLQSSLRAVIGQRLVRLLCERCKSRHEITKALIEEDPRYSAVGFEPGDHVCLAQSCERCSGTGYRGRTGVFEVLEITSDVRKLIASRADAHDILALARSSGMTTMFEDGLVKSKQGITSLSEVLRVATAD